jgi:hypothetical protein
MPGGLTLMAPEVSPTPAGREWLFGPMKGPQEQVPWERVRQQSYHWSSAQISDQHALVAYAAAPQFTLYGWPLGLHNLYINSELILRGRGRGLAAA